MTVPAPSQLDLRQEVHDAARRARVAARRLASLPTSYWLTATRSWRPTPKT
ncbi:gamma-glutamyl phosphate reductase [Mycobacterium tuberculosis]|nr:gamma-glutamyl phosphate reductase [Mycobacterium tuberculosis]